MPFLLLFAISIQVNFEGGSLGKVDQAGPAHYRCAVKGEADQDGRNRQANWYFFRVDGGQGKLVVIELTGLVGEYNYKPGTHAVTRHTRPVYSYDNRSWRHFRDDQVSWNDARKELRLELTPDRDRIWIAHVPPYTNAHLKKLLDEARGAKREIIGRTADGRPMELLTITDGGVPAGEKAGEKKVAWLMFRQHSWETGSSWAGEGAIRHLLSEKGAELRKRVVWKIFPMADPDGVARGGVRFNKHGYDLNRNWDLVKEDRMPEIASQKKAVLDWMRGGGRVDLFLTLHNTESGEYLEGPPVELGRRFFEALKERTTFHPSSPLRVAAESTTAGQAGRMIVTQGLWAERRIPAFLIEQRVEYNEKLGRHPTVEDRIDFGAGLVEAIGAALR